MRDLTERALDTATALGAGYAETRVVRRRDESIAIKSGRVEGVASGESEGFGVRVLLDGAWGFASSHVLGLEAADRIAAEAVRIADSEGAEMVLEDVRPSTPKVVARFRAVGSSLKHNLGDLGPLAENAGVDGAVVAGKVRESNDKNFGFNAQTEEYGDMFKFGVIDPAKVVRIALEDAASVASLLITTEAMIADKPAEKAGAGGAGGGMGGGMGGMGDF